MNLKDLTLAISSFSEANRPIRLRLSHEKGVLDDVLLVKRVVGTETLCGGLEYRLLCVSTNATLPLKDFLALPVELQFVTDRGDLRSVCGIVAQSAAGQSDGGLATYQLVVRDALALMEKRNNTRVFRNLNEVDITKVILGEWRNKNPALIKAFDFDLSCLRGEYPAREFTMQHRESDAAFLRRLWKRRGIAWFVRPGKATEHGSNDTPAHTLVMFDDASLLPRNAAGTVRYHRDAATEERAGITAWLPVRTLTPGGVTRQSWDYKQVRMMEAQSTSRIDQGSLGNQFAVSLDDYLVDPPHAGDTGDDYRQLGELRMKRHEYESKCFHGEGGGPGLCVGEWIGLAGHPEIDTHPAEEREFVLTALSIDAENNLPKDLDGTVSRLFAANRWSTAQDAALLEATRTERDMRFSNAFTCVRRGIPIVPAFDPRSDLPPAHPVTAIVAGPEGEEVHCDEQGRINLNFPGCRPKDHAHAQGAGASRSNRDSAWVRVGCGWAGSGYGVSALPRAGMEATVIFMDGDVDKPLIISLTHNGANPPPAFSHTGNLPGNKYLSGIKSKEVKGARYNQLRLDDTPDQINAQLASEHAHSELNLGWLTHPRRDGKGEARGEGAELRSDEHIALRAAKGMLLTAWQRLNASDKQLARDEYLALMEQCVELFRSLGNYAAEHQALPLDDKPQTELQSAVKQWENGSNTAPQGREGGAPVIGITAPAGISFATPKTLVSYAGVNYDNVAQQHMHLTAGQRFNLNAGKGISLFSHHDGIKAIAHHGKFLMQSQHDDTEINAAKNIKLTATDGNIILMAKEIHAIAEDGSFIKIGGGGITLGTNGAIAQKAANFPFSGPATLSTELPTFGSGNADQKFALAYGAHTEDAMIAPNRLYEITMGDGSVIKGKSDAEGKTNILQRDVIHIADIRILTDEE
ncbi:MAG: rhs element Vgr family protein [Burkholderia sp.]|jgi:type VI secretion system secreted protein VgrG|nr:rhs element Vgr family protein [Burkholderia sp.]